MESPELSSPARNTLPPTSRSRKCLKPTPVSYRGTEWKAATSSKSRVVATVRAIRKKNTPTAGRYHGAKRALEADLTLLEDPNAPAVSQWPPKQAGTSSSNQIFSPQTVGTSFQTIALSP